MIIREDDLSGAAVAKLLRQHRDDMVLHSPPESIHALDLDALRGPDISFWCAWEGDQLAGCGALRDLGDGHGEIKSMRTATAFLRQGVAGKILQHILNEAKRCCYRKLSLETGSTEPFRPARNLYASYGFEHCEPFADYIDDPYSVWMTKEL